MSADPTPRRRSRPGPLTRPDEIARDRVHRERAAGSCAVDRDKTAACDCRPGKGEVAAAWAGRARMAAARQAAGAVLDEVDREALDRTDLEETL